MNTTPTETTPKISLFQKIKPLVTQKNAKIFGGIVIGITIASTSLFAINNAGASRSQEEALLDLSTQRMQYQIELSEGKVTEQNLISELEILEAELILSQQGNDVIRGKISAIEQQEIDIINAPLLSEKVTEEVFQ